MTDVAADAERGTAERDTLVLRLGAAGRGRAEIAAALGLSRSQLVVRAAEDASLATALQRASDLALAWWEAMPNDAYEAGVRFNYAAWGREMGRRFGEAAPRGAGQGAKARAAPVRGVETATYLIPCNGRTKLRPDGTCPCSAYHNEEYWRAGDERWRAENPDNYDDDPDDLGDDDLDDEEEMTDDE